jgi:hypothetical protein
LRDAHLAQDRGAGFCLDLKLFDQLQRTPVEIPARNIEKLCTGVSS